MKHLSYIIAALMLLAVSCKEDIKLDIEDTTGVLCVNGFLYSDCDTNVLYITKTGVMQPQNVNNATVKMFVNGVLTEEKVKSDDDEAGGVYILHTIFKSGDVVKVEVDCGEHHVWNEGTVPQSPKDLDAQVTFEPHKTYYDMESEEYETEDMYRLNISFTDVSSDRNYYRLYTKKDAYVKSYRNVWYQIPDTIYFDGEPYYGSKDTSYYDYVTFRGSNMELYIRESPELVDEEMTANNQLLDASTYNYYKIFTNERFAGGKCNLKVYERVKFGDYYSPSVPPETESVWGLEDTLNISEYNYVEYVGIESIDEGTYYYVKALNGFESGNFSDQELTGAVKMRRNVNGGSGNISLVSRIVKKIVVYDHYKPKWVLRGEDDDDELYYK